LSHVPYPRSPRHRRPRMSDPSSRQRHRVTSVHGMELYHWLLFDNQILLLMNPCLCSRSAPQKGHPQGFPVQFHLQCEYSNTNQVPWSDAGKKVNRSFLGWFLCLHDDGWFGIRFTCWDSACSWIRDSDCTEQACSNRLKELLDEQLKWHVVAQSENDFGQQAQIRLNIIPMIPSLIKSPVFGDFAHDVSNPYLLIVFAHRNSIV